MRFELSASGLPNITKFFEAIARIVQVCQRYSVPLVMINPPLDAINGTQRTGVPSGNNFSISAVSAFVQFVLTNSEDLIILIFIGRNMLGLFTPKASHLQIDVNAIYGPCSIRP